MFCADFLQAGQHTAVLDAEIIFFLIDGLPAGQFISVAVKIVGFSGSPVPAGVVFSALLQAQIFRDRSCVRLTQALEEGLIFELCGVALIGHEGVLHDHGGDPVSLVVKKDSVVVALFAAGIAAAPVIAVSGAGPSVGQTAPGNPSGKDLGQLFGLCADGRIEAAVLMIDADSVGRRALALAEGVVVETDKNICVIVLCDAAAGLKIGG